jgi:hypothetical protein
VGANEQQGGRFERGPLAIYYRDGFGLRCTMSDTIGRRWRCSGRHCALSAGVCSVSSVAAWLGRNTGGFSWDTIGFRLGPVATVHHDAR